MGPEEATVNARLDPDVACAARDEIASFLAEGAGGLCGALESCGQGIALTGMKG